MGQPLSFFPTDLATDLDPLSMEDRGVYLTFLRHGWSYGGPMPIDEVEALIGKPWLSTGLLLRRRFTENEGRLSLPWMEEKRHKATAFSEMQSAKGKLGGRPAKGKKPGKSRSLTKRKPDESPRVGNGYGNGNGLGIGEGKEKETPFDEAGISPEDAKAANTALHDLSPDWKHYTDAISTYSAVKSIKRTRKGWLATYRQFINGDNQKGILKSTKPTTTAAWNPRA